MTCELIDDVNRSDNFRLEEQSNLTLVFDAGMGNWSLFFYPVVKELRPFAKICLINRDGYFDSGMNKPKDIITVAHQMKAILDEHQITGPIVLVGHSLGALHVRMFQQLLPEQVVGLILLDGAHPKLYEVLPQVQLNIAKQIQFVNMLKLLAKFRLLGFAKNNIPTFGLPIALHKQYYTVTTRPEYYCTYQSEMKYFGENLALCNMLNRLGELPLLVISSPYGLKNPMNEKEKLNINEDTVWISLQMDLLNLSSQSYFIKSKGDHFLHLTDTTTVSKAIHSFCEIIQTKLLTQKHLNYE